MKRICKTTILVSVLALTTRLAYAVDYTETSTTYNSHDLIASAETIAAGAASLDHIVGTLSINQGTGLSEMGDVYKIFISDPANFSASTTSLAGGKNGFDTQLFLFRLDGTGIAVNDDKPPGSQSLLPAGNSLYSGLTQGYYYLVIDGSGSYPADSSGVRIFPNQPEGADPTGVYGPKNGTPNETNSPFTQYSGTSNQGGTYSIALTGVTISAVPEPSSVALIFGTAMAGAIWRMKRRS